LGITQRGDRTVIGVGTQTLAVLLGVNATALTASAATSFTTIG
jgi:hypothetical protein